MQSKSSNPPARVANPPDLRRVRRRWAFRILAMLLPLWLVLGLEGLARWKGYGGYPPAITHVGSDGRSEWYSTFRPGVDSFFYTRKSHTGGMRTMAFTTPKPKDTIRVVLFGGSAVQGYPQELPLTCGAFLQAMLPDCQVASNRVEVLNLGATAMASFPALCFLEEMLNHQPDLVIVMSGNNEFYGAYGVCSLHSSGTSARGMRAMRWIRGTGLAQWMEAHLAPKPDETALVGKPLMQLVAARQQVKSNDPLRRAAQQTLQANLTRMVRLCRAADVPILLCTLPTNERGLAPVGEDLVASRSAVDQQPISNLLASAEAALQDDPSAAAGQIEEALRLDGNHARAHFLLGQARTALGDHVLALNAYVAARDLDTMPWRATSAANAAVREAAANGAVLCDMEGAFRAVSPGGAIGWELMDDHVHMSLQGQALFARTVMHCLTNLTGPLQTDPIRVRALPPSEAYADRLGHSIYTDYVVASRMRSIFDIPFMKRSNPEAGRRWQSEMQRLYAAMSEVDRQAVEHWKDPELHVTNHRPLAGVVGYYRMMNDDCEAASPLFRVARECVSNISLWRLQFTWYLIDCQREQKGSLDGPDLLLCREAIEVGELLQRFAGFPDPWGPSFLGMAYHATGDYQACIRYLDDAVRYAKGKEGVDVVCALADSLIKEGQSPRAELLLNLARKDPAIRAEAEQMLIANGLTVR